MTQLPELYPKAKTRTRPRLRRWFCDTSLRIAVCAHAEVKWWHSVFIFSCISVLFCLIQIFLPPPFGLLQLSKEVSQQPFSDGGCEDGLNRCICVSETVCARDRLSVILLILARTSVFFDYPLYMIMFLSKAHNLNNVLRRTMLRWWVDFSDMHHLHNLFGIVVGIETTFHSFFHLLRWGLQNNIQLLWKTQTGTTGLIALVCTPLIVCPMALPWLKKRMSFEMRKLLHYLSWVWALELLFHAPSRIYWLIGAPSLVYAIDWFVGYFVNGHVIEDVRFERYGETGLIAHFENPKGFNSSKTSYVYIMCPWLTKYQWHAFSLFPHPREPNHSMICIGVVGDWTEELYKKVQRPTIKPLNVLGPFRSEFADCTVGTTKTIAVASGIGITPTLSLMQTYVDTKRVNIVWICRDPGLIEYFLHNVDFSFITKSSFIFIFYTGKRELVLPSNLHTNLLIFQARPDLKQLFAGIISIIESGEDLPEEMCK